MTQLKFIFGCTLVIFLHSLITPTTKWYKYQGKDFEILFPGLPKNDTIVKETSVGKIVANRLVLKSEPADKDSNIAYEFVETIYSSNDLANATKELAEHVFKGTINSSLKALNGNLVSEKDINLDGYYGKDVKISFDKATKIVRMRCCVAKGKVYAAEIIALTGNENNSNAETFFQSFKIN